MRQIAFVAVFTFALFCLSFPAMDAWGQAAPRQLYVVCYSQANQPTVYFSGILQGPVAALQAFRTAFAQFLMKTYSYQGSVVCAPTNTLANAQSALQRQASALAAAKKSVLQTGWTEAAPAAGVAGAATNAVGSIPGGGGTPSTAAAPAVSGGQAAGTNTAAGGSATSGSTATSIINSIFGAAPPASTPAAGGASGTMAPPQSQAAGKASGGTAASTAPASQVVSTLSGLFRKGSASGSTPNSGGNSAKSGTPAARGAGQPAPPAASPGTAPGGPALPDGALGAAQFSNTKLIVYGCGRQALQVACVADLTNQNTQDTLVKSADVWKDAFIVDDRGDRHLRTDGFFLNIDGEQRQQLDISFGKSARFVLMFDGVQTKVQKITLRSATGGLNVPDITLIIAAASEPSGQAQPGESGQAQPAVSH